MLRAVLITLLRQATQLGFSGRRWTAKMLRAMFRVRFTPSEVFLTPRRQLPTATGMRVPDDSAVSPVPTDGK